jgi:hypothetical protein
MKRTLLIAGVCVCTVALFTSSARAEQITGTVYFEHQAVSYNHEMARVRVQKKLGARKVPVTTISCGNNALGTILGNVLQGKKPTQGMGQVQVAPQQQWADANNNHDLAGSGCTVSPGTLTAYAILVRDGSNNTYQTRVYSKAAYDRVHVGQTISLRVPLPQLVLDPGGVEGLTIIQ